MYYKKSHKVHKKDLQILFNFIMKNQFLRIFLLLMRGFNLNSFEDFFIFFEIMLFSLIYDLFYRKIEFFTF